MADPGGYDLLLVPRDGGESRSLRLGRTQLRFLGGVLGAIGLVTIMMAGSWVWVAGRAATVPSLQARIDSLQQEQAKVGALVLQLQGLEERYGRVRDLFGTPPGPASELWTPPSGGRPSVSGDELATSFPESWPLTEAGFVTRSLLDDPEADHPGLDIAIPTGSYIRASGGGVVLDVGEDPVYGLFVSLDHGDGVVSLYGHASRTLVVRGQTVARDEVIGLTGNTGRSTAPHLHFEIRRDGEPQDPSIFVQPPN